VVTSNNLVLADGQPITVNWVPPTVQGVSKISIRINISYHGGTKGEIQCETEDNGTLTIPAEMLDRLKSYGLAGFPCVYVTRKSTGIDEKTKAMVSFETTITIPLTIPGLVSCNDDDECPSHNCIDKQCQ
jgi:hypothetical protein